MTRFEQSFAALIAVQAAHSMEEYIGRLWETFPPARFVTSLVSLDHERGFVILNAILVALGIWCVLFPVRRRWAIAVPLVWMWVAIEVINGIVHPLWSVLQQGYTPGLLTAPVLFILALWLAAQLRMTASRDRREVNR